MSDDALHYRSAGVDLRASDDAKARIAKLVASTWTAGMNRNASTKHLKFRLRNELIAGAEYLINCGHSICAVRQRGDGLCSPDLINPCRSA